ncbi:MAG TPA: membrane dipeptidase [Gemmatimonadales bacterium]
MTHPVSATARQVHRQATVVDLHAHPSLKTFFSGVSFKDSQTVNEGFKLTELRTNYPSLLAGDIDVLCSAVYVPEKYLRHDCWVIHFGSHFIQPLKVALDGDPFDIALRVLRHMESEVAAVNAMTPAPARTAAVVTSNQELDAALGAGQLAVIHTIEGAHVLNGDVTNVALLKAEGVASITLAHFYPNGVAPPVEAIPKDVFLRTLRCFQFQEDLTARLPQTGKDVVEEMYHHGVVVDLTHTTRPARRDVYAIPNPRHRPIVMSHVGAASLYAADINAYQEDIDAIRASGGVVGVIFYNYWLVNDYHRQDTLHHVVRHVRELANTGGEDLVALGSDWDGMTDPPNDLKEPADWPRLTDALLAAGFTSTQVEKFLGGNARRVLRDGWG